MQTKSPSSTQPAVSASMQARYNAADQYPNIVESLKKGYRTNGANGKPMIGIMEHVTYADFRKYHAANLSEAQAQNLYAQLAGPDGKLEGREIDSAKMHLVVGKAKQDQAQIKARQEELKQQHAAWQQKYHPAPKAKVPTAQANTSAATRVKKEEGTNAISLQMNPATMKNGKEIYDWHPKHHLSEDCRRDKLGAVPSDTKYQAIDAKIAQMVKAEGGADGKVRKIVLYGHADTGVHRINLSDSPILKESSNGNVLIVEEAYIAAKYIERGGELIIYGCNVAPDTEAGRQVRDELVKIAMEHGITIKTSSIKPKDCRWKSLNPIMICPDGKILPDNTPEQS